MTYKGRLVYIDKSGNEHQLMPVTEKALIEGMESIDQHLTTQGNPHGTTAADVGATPLTDEGLTSLLAKGAVVLTAQHYGSEFPKNPVAGQLFFKKV